MRVCVFEKKNKNMANDEQLNSIHRIITNEFCEFFKKCGCHITNEHEINMIQWASSFRVALDVDILSYYNSKVHGELFNALDRRIDKKVFRVYNPTVTMSYDNHHVLFYFSVHLLG